MSGRSSPTFRKRRLGRKLKALRERAGLTLDDAAPLLDKTRTSLHRIEIGETLADVHLVRSMMDVYDHYEPGLIDLARDAAKKSWLRSFDVSDQGYVDMETEAGRVLDFQIISIPGLLQTKDYMRAQFSGWYLPTRRSADHVTVRLKRQERLTDEENQLHLHAIVDESSLRRVVGGHDVMRTQLRHLVTMADLPTVLLQVFPAGQGAHTAMSGAFTLLTFPEPDDPEMMYIEHPTGSVHIEEIEKVREAKLIFKHLSATALPPAESVRLIEQVFTEL
ncbi:helix-turn-helix domain-containing protein [Amycolatopsis nigrescens]|uniref:helix-turn-helix domain-containing protein n=1 Tax=Amycolatopsis nigrescens TaxID=381445 RepID=UPI00058E6C5C|nr:helix-turn-helix transcriptional regulator [Amycolatopsis nigrescens]